MLPACGLIIFKWSVEWALMADKRNSKSGWTQAERAAFRKLLRMGLILFLAIVIAGAIAALLSSALGTL